MPSLRQVLVKLDRMAIVLPPRSLPTKRLFFLLIITRFISRSDTLLSSGTAASSRKVAMAATGSAHS